MSKGLNGLEVDNSVAAEKIGVLLQFVLLLCESLLKLHAQRICDYHHWRHKDANKRNLPAKVEPAENASDESESAFKLRGEAFSTDSIDDRGILGHGTCQYAAAVFSEVKPADVLPENLLIENSSDLECDVLSEVSK